MQNKGPSHTAAPPLEPPRDHFEVLLMHTEGPCHPAALPLEPHLYHLEILLHTEGPCHPAALPLEPVHDYSNQSLYNPFLLNKINHQLLVDIS